MDRSRQWSTVYDESTTGRDDAEPLGAESKPSDNEFTKIMVWGKVTALVFHVKVAWDFEITPNHKIHSVKVNLLASLGELLTIRPV